MQRIAVCVDPATGYGRQVLRGIANWLRAHGGWSVLPSGPSDNPSANDWLCSNPVDGIVADGVPVPGFLLRTRVPRVVLGHGDAAVDSPGIHPDDEAIGGLAADHLIDHGFRSLACCGGPSESHRRRQVGFVARARNRSCEVNVHESSSVSPSLAPWLRSLPRPVGLAAFDDCLALTVLDALREIGMRVPDDAAVVGVGNDDVLCELASPGLTSVAPNAVRMGFLAAETLAAALAGDRGALARRIVVPPLGVEIRGSTDTLSVADVELKTALRIIQEQACRGLTIDDLADATLLTRRTLERRFQKELGRSIHDEILRVKIAAVRRALAESDAKLVTVAAETGFADVASLCHAFKRVTGQRPGDYRKSRRG